jgi:hypothetical protein
MRNIIYTIFYVNKINILRIFPKNIFLFVFSSIIILIISNAFNIYLFSYTDEIIDADASPPNGQSVM